MFQDKLEKHLQARNAEVLGKKNHILKKKKLNKIKGCLSMEIEKFPSNTKANWKQSPEEENKTQNNPE